MPEDEKRPRFEEQVALRELERLQAAIEETRVRRRRANEAFDSFLKSFNERPPAGPAPAAVAPGPDFASADTALRTSPPPPPPPFPPAPTAELPPEPPHPALEAQHSVSPSPAVTPEVPRIPAALALPAAGRSPYRYAAGAGIAVAVAITVALVAWRGRGGERPVTAPRETAVQAAPAAAPAPAPTSGSAQLPSAQLVTSRRVWMRVSVDGAQTIEREVAENTTIPLQATSQIVVRAGDAGAVRVVIAGKDLGPLGPDGQVRTRAYPIAPTR